MATNMAIKPIIKRLEQEQGTMKFMACVRQYPTWINLEHVIELQIAYSLKTSNYQLTAQMIDGRTRVIENGTKVECEYVANLILQREQEQ